MKKLPSLLLSILVIVAVTTNTVNAQNKSGKKNATTVVQAPAAVQSDWKEYDALQSLLASTYAASQAGDVVPIQKHASEISNLSILLAKSNYPDANDNVEFRTLLGEFTDRCEELVNSVNAEKSAEELSSELAALNQSFTQITALRDAQRLPKE